MHRAKAAFAYSQCLTGLPAEYKRVYAREASKGSNLHIFNKKGVIEIKENSSSHVWCLTDTY